ncbi:MAG TPA: dethiobiotin synthase [Bryobacteraceae bacterium]|nr:dethiobiotin synthase [Bryobacteraceae bacterium]
MIRGLFVTGTDTGVGKTVACAALLHRYRGVAPLCYWKPVQTGMECDDDTNEVRRLASARDAEIFDQGLRFDKPVSPHLAAKRAGQTISLHRLRRLLPSGEETRWIVEGAGGALVPLNDASTMADFMAMLGLPVVIAARSGLGTVNHTLLTMEALRSRSIGIAGIVMIGDPDEHNAEAIERYGRAPVIAQMPRFDPLTPESLAEWSFQHFDPRGLLRERLR